MTFVVKVGWGGGQGATYPLPRHTHLRPPPPPHPELRLNPPLPCCFIIVEFSVYLGYSNQFYLYETSPLILTHSLKLQYLFRSRRGPAPHKYYIQG